ncbi:TonB-dependent receptor [Novosphingobium sp. ZN18A2]|uniref:TonB-dependent receptor n=1 Tax=Novosphingobium sp. ZN18A2 TaxID=3079861 RepID=UPI0030D1E2C1
MTRTLRTRLRIGASLALALCADLAFAPTSAFAQEKAEGADRGNAPAAEIVVTGSRISEADKAIGTDEVTATVAVTRKALLSAPSGVSGLKMLEQLPGFNVQTDGSLGLYEFGNSVHVRAFDLSQIGFVLDGVPLGRSDAFGGSPVFRYVDNENLGSVVASVGAGDVSMPSYDSLGPVVAYNSIEPQEDLGLFVSQSFGDFGMKRTFIRLSTGRIGPFKAYVSRTKLDSDLWRGAGGVHREHWEAIAHADIGSSSWLRLKFVSNDFNDNDSPFLSLAGYTSGTDLGGKSGRWQGYIDVPPPTTPGFTSTVAGVDYSNSNYTYTYPLAINIRHDRLYAATLHGGITDNFSAESTLYWEHKAGFGVSPDSYANSLGLYSREAAYGLPVTAPKGVQYGKSGVPGDRYGITAKLSWEWGIQSIEAGIWAETDKYHRTQLRLNTTDGSPASPATDEAVYLRRDYHSKRDTTQLFLRDRIKFMDDRLIADLGVKALNLDYTLNGYRDYADYFPYYAGQTAAYGPGVGSAHYSDFFLPTAGLLFKLDQRTQFFASYAENMALPRGMDDIFSTTLSSTSAFVPAPTPERSRNFELGVRTNQSQFFASLAFYYTRFSNRIQQLAVPLPGSSGATESYYVNVGRVKSYGAEFAGTYKPAFLNGLAYANLNVTYNVAKYMDNMPDGTPSADHYVVDSPKWLVSGGVTVEPAPWLVANFSGKYTGKRYADVTNYEPIAVRPYTVFNAYVDIGEGIQVGPLKSVKARINVDNVFDKDILSFILPLAPQFAYYRPLSPRTFQFTISAEY